VSGTLPVLAGTTAVLSATAETISLKKQGV
jgi:hypothetical protein